MASLTRNTLVPSLLLLLAASCTEGYDGTSTGNPNEPGKEGNETGGGFCEVVSRRPVALDDRDLGFSARELLALIPAERSETLRWQELDIATYAPEHGEQPLTLRITKTEAPPQLADYAGGKSGREGVEINLAGTTGCDDALELEVEVSLQTQGGALQERFRATLSAHSKEHARIFHRLDPRELDGSFAITEVQQPGFALTNIALTIELTRFGSSGELSPSFEKRSVDSLAQAAGGPLASWGLADCGPAGTPVPLDAKVATFSASEVIALVNQAGTSKVDWSDGTSSDLTLHFTPAQDGACAVLVDRKYVLEGKAGTLLIPGTLKAQSADDHIDAEWKVVTTARPNPSGALEQVAIAPDPYASRNLLPSDGLHGFDTSGYDSIGAGFMFAVAPSGAWSGTVTLTGYEAPNCPPPMISSDPNGGSSSPGCPGSTPHQIARATITPH